MNEICMCDPKPGQNNDNLVTDSIPFLEACIWAHARKSSKKIPKPKPLIIKCFILHSEKKKKKKWNVVPRLHSVFPNRKTSTPFLQSTDFQWVLRKKAFFCVCAFLCSTGSVIWLTCCHTYRSVCWGKSLHFCTEVFNSNDTLFMKVSTY